MTRRRATGLGRWIEYVLLLTAVVCLGWYCFVTVHAAAYKMWADAEVEKMLAAAAAENAAAQTQKADGRTQLPGEPGTNAPQKKVNKRGTLLGKIEIPRLGIDVPLREGADDATLRLAAGHIPETSDPGEDGNVGIAAHRNTHFRPLQYVQQGDEIKLSTSKGVLRYRVATTKLVRPSDVWVLDKRDKPSLTLVTCYPFKYVGNAPLRFIVWAERIDEERGAQSGTR